MTQALCSDKKKFRSGFNLFAFSVKKNIGVIILGISLSALLCAYLGSEMVRYDWASRHMADWFKEITLIFITASCIIETILGFINFGYLYSKPATDMFHSLPVSSSKLLIIRTAATYVGSAVIWIVSMLSFLITFAFVDAKLISMAVFAEMILNGLLVMLIYAAVLAFHAVIAGNTVGMIFGLAVTQVAVPVISLVLQIFADEILIGYAHDDFINDGAFCNYSVMFKVIYVFVMRVAASSHTDIHIWSYLLTVLASLAITAVVMLLATVIYKRRRSEAAGQAFSFGFLKWIAVIIATTLISHLVGLLFAGSEVNDPMYWTFTVFGAAITAVFICAITDKGFVGVKKALISSVVSVIILAIVFGSITLYSKHFNSYIPKENDIKTATVYIGDTKVDFSLNLKLVTTLQKSLINDYETGGDNIDIYPDKPTLLQSVTVYGNTQLDFVYKLKNGKTVKRDYVADTSVMAEILAIKKTYNFRKAMTTPPAQNKVHYRNIDLNPSGKYENYNFEYTMAEYKEIVTAYCDDIAALNNDDLTKQVSENDFIRLYCYGETETVYLKIPVCEQFQRTITEIEEAIGVQVNVG